MTTRKTVQPNWLSFTRLTVSVLFVWSSFGTAYASLTNVIWEAKIQGKMAIQEFATSVEPRAKVTSFKSADFLRMVTGQSVAGGSKVAQPLALNIDMVGGRTNLYLTTFNRDNRENQTRLTTNETTTMISDGANLIFSMEAPLLAGGTNGIAGIASTWGGGFVRIVGSGKIVNGVPAVLKGQITGYFIDTRPGDLKGTTGLLERTKFRTSNAPLRVQPAN